MNRHLAGGVLMAVVGALVLACGSGAGAATPRPVGTTQPPATTEPAATEPSGGGGETAAGEDVCAAMAEPLVLAALGEPAAEPQFGDVAGADGVYCFFPATADAATSVEVQYSTMSQAAFNQLAETLGAEDPLAGVGRSAFTREGAYTGVAGASVLAWDDGETAVVLIERSGADQAALTETAKQIAAAVLAAL